MSAEYNDYGSTTKLSRSVTAQSQTVIESFEFDYELGTADTSGKPVKAIDLSARLVQRTRSHLSICIILWLLCVKAGPTSNTTMVLSVQLFGKCSGIKYRLSPRCAYVLADAVPFVVPSSAEAQQRTESAR